MSGVLYGVFTVGDVHVALPLSELREVIPCPSSFNPLLADAPGLVGAVMLRHQVIPVLDLRRVLGAGSPSGQDVVVVASFDGSVFGLLADEVRGVVAVEEHERLGISVNGELPQVFAWAFERPEDGAVVCVLDCAAVRRMPGMVVAADTGGPSGAMAQAQEQGRSGVAGHRRMMMLLRAGEIGQVGGSCLVIDGSRLRADPELGTLAALGTPVGGSVEVDPAAARVLLVGGVGFIVPGLRAIEESTWEERVAEDAPVPLSLAGSPLVKIGPRMLARLDLAEFARTMVGVRDDGTDQGGD